MPTRTQKLEVLRRWLEGIDALRGLLEDADKAERFLGESQGAIEAATRRAEAAQREALALEERRATIQADVETERERLLAPARAELAHLSEQAQASAAQMAADRKAFEEELGRRTNIVRTIEEQTQTARRAHVERLGQIRDEGEREKASLRRDIETLRAERGLAEQDVERVRAEYRAITEAAAKLAGR